jgi:hypothetical protein
VEDGDKPVEGQYDAFVAPFTLAPYSKNRIRGLRGGSIDLIIRWLALMFSLGAWAGIALVMVTYLG